jgi:hypothetical protein
MPSSCTLIADMSSLINPQVKAAKVAYKQRLSEAVQWLQREGQGGTVANASRVYEVKEDAIRMALKRARQYTKQKRAQVLHGGHNKVVSDTQSKAIEAYCYEQWEIRETVVTCRSCNGRQGDVRRG